MAKPTFDLQDYISTNELPTLSNISNISIKPLVKIYKNDDGDDYPITFYFLYYDKDQLTMNNYETTGLFRSILIDKNKHMAAAAKLSNNNEFQIVDYDSSENITPSNANYVNGFALTTSININRIWLD